MIENFITDILIDDSRNIKDFQIHISKENRQHLILTGKNGSGKTSLLLEINKFLNQINSGNFHDYELYKQHLKNTEEQLKDNNLTSGQKTQFEENQKAYKQWFIPFGGVQIKFSNTYDKVFEKMAKGEFIIAFFDSKRHTQFNIPQGINKIEIQKKYQLEQKANLDFIQYIVNLKADRSFARDEKEEETVKEIDEWFEKFENRLKSIFDTDDLILYFNRKSYNFDIIIDKKSAFNFNNLSDGYSAILSIVTELLLRMEAHNSKFYNLEGLVIIDEIETHLHVELQKKILPILSDFFPKIQFVITTHSPFVLSSLSKTTICDLETKVVTNDLSGYSYDALIESYFKSDKYSEIIKEKIKEFDALTSIDSTTTEQIIKIRDLRNYFAHTPKYLSNELLVKLQQIELKELNNKKK